ncbi:glycosyltransferase family 39 protein [Clostridium sp. DJ247]|uniref:ArnT family glycosyltransferase n=1 Tax=Clostridium sp. DJ247 TaxID=2726188 RepID=UPI00162506F6|nr:glycosyltransferase family 39 protein [Clostridium sp. DJ247]MBC2581624.1 glycosyl transferase [Clostridium sp. DJ247]
MKVKLNVVDKLLDVIEKYYYVFLIIIFSLTIFNLFYYLKDTPIYSWDEARHGISAYEMLKKQEYIVNTYGYKNDYWNLKPPMSFWFIMLGYKLAGFNALGLRLFSAIAAFITIFISSLFVKYKHGKVSSLICAVILTVSPKYIVIHSARTGDADSLLVLFFTISMLSMILIHKNIKFFYLSGLGFSCAFLTKSWHALNIIIIGFIYLLFTKILFKLKLKQWGMFLLSAFGPILIWGILRYRKDGFEFFYMMINYDLLSRTSTTLEGHIGDKWFYFSILKTFYSIWLSLLATSFIFYITTHLNTIYMNRFKIKEKHYILALVLWITIPLILYTNAKTKIAWYILPVYIPIAISISLLCHKILRGVKRNIVVQLVTIVLIIKGIYDYENVIKNHIVSFKNDNRRVTFNKTYVSQDIQGIKAYIYYDDYTPINVGPMSEFKSWRQSDMLQAELFWDLVPEDGGLEAFLKDNNEKSIIILPKKQIVNNLIKEKHLNVLSDGGYFYILNKDVKYKKDI